MKNIGKRDQTRSIFMNYRELKTQQCVFIHDEMILNFKKCTMSYVVLIIIRNQDF